MNLCLVGGSGLEQGDRDSGSGWSAGWEAVGVRGGCDEGCESVTCKTSVVEFHINLRTVYK